MIWSNRLENVTMRATVFCISLNLFKRCLGRPYNKELQLSSLGCIHYVCYRGAGAEDFFFSGSFFYIPPKVHTNFHNPPPSNQSKNEYPPLLPHKTYENKYLYNSTLYMFEISRDMFNKNIERPLTVYVIPMPASLSSAN